ncbi:hypothetical protein [Streptomyces halobius]|uniref:Uncharacterized protein n=1 Tax=Streptomyces halobius TaxID=2879846 RepID=A0ABY4M601_9ACTN|nr:hypothetical protein [Streptomyces halobius]UQA91661.1 hypothetical protein K9S39_07100 [Streptomyces halobius]
MTKTEAEQHRLELAKRTWKSLATLLNIMDELDLNPTLPEGYMGDRIVGNLGSVRRDENGRKWIAVTQ